MEGLSVNQMLVLDKKNYQIPYDSIQSFKVESKLMKKAVEIRYDPVEQHRHLEKKYSVSSDAIATLFENLPEIRPLDGKLTFSVEGAFRHEL